MPLSSLSLSSNDIDAAQDLVPKFQPAAEEKLGLLENDDNLRLVASLLLLAA